MVTWFDFLLIVMLFGGMLVGFGLGLFRQLLNLMGLYLGLVVATVYQNSLARTLEDWFGDGAKDTRDAFTYLIVTLLVWGLVNVGAYFAFQTPPRFRPAVVDRIGGLLLGIASGLVIGVIVLVLLRFGTSVPWPNYNGLRLFVGDAVEGALLGPLFESLIPRIVATIEPWVSDRSLPPLLRPQVP